MFHSVYKQYMICFITYIDIIFTILFYKFMGGYTANYTQENIIKNIFLSYSIMNLMPIRKKFEMKFEKSLDGKIIGECVLITHLSSKLNTDEKYPDIHIEAIFYSHENKYQSIIRRMNKTYKKIKIDHLTKTNRDQMIFNYMFALFNFLECKSLTQVYNNIEEYKNVLEDIIENFEK